MKNLALTVVLGFAALSVSAQSWNVGARTGSGFQADVQRVFGNDNYLEGRFGALWANGGGTVTADFTLLYVWDVFSMNWTPRGQWFFDAGAGLNVGGRGHYAYVGPMGMAKLGYEFDGAPVRLSFDWSPAFGAGIAYWNGTSASQFNRWGLANLGITCVYCF